LKPSAVSFFFFLQPVLPLPLLSVGLGFTQFVAFRSSSFVDLPSLFSTVVGDKEQIGNDDRMGDERQMGESQGIDDEKPIGNGERIEDEQKVQTSKRE
jgi:hypothetical protein